MPVRLGPQPLNCRCTSALSVLPSARPATFACNAFITAPICAFELAPTSVIVSCTTFEISSVLIACGKYAFKIDNSSFSFAASSARPPFSKLSIESSRCFACLRTTCAASVLLSWASAPDFAIAAYFNADLSIRRTPSLLASFARMASFKSKSIRSSSVIRGNYGGDIRLSRYGQPDAAARRLPVNSLSAFPHRFRVTHRNDIRAFSRSLQQTSQHAAGPQLNKEIASKRRKPLHAIQPADRADDLILQCSTNFIRRFHFPSGNIADHSEARCLYR